MMMMMLYSKYSRIRTWIVYTSHCVIETNKINHYITMCSFFVKVLKT